MHMHRGINLISNGNHVRTTLALEKVFWESIDEIFGKNWRHWVIEQLNDKPGEISNSSWRKTSVVRFEGKRKIHVESSDDEDVEIQKEINTSFNPIKEF